MMKKRVFDTLDQIYHQVTIKGWIFSLSVISTWIADDISLTNLVVISIMHMTMKPILNARIIRDKLT